MSIAQPAPKLKSPSGTECSDGVYSLYPHEELALIIPPRWAWSLVASLNYNHCVPPGLTPAAPRFAMQFTAIDMRLQFTTLALPH